MNLEQTVLQVHIEDIIPNRFQPRLNFDEQGLQELAASIKEHGIIQPLVLRKLGDKYEIIAGERRYKAAQIAGLTTVPAVISNIDDNKSAEVALVENVQRRDLTAIEEARSYKNLLDKGYLTQEQLAKRMGLSQPAIANKLRLLNLDDEVQEALLEEKISERHARTLLNLPKDQQREWLHRIINERMTVRQLDIELKKIQGYNETSEDDTSNNGDIPLITKIPSIEDIKANARDIRDLNNDSHEELETFDIIDEPKPTENKASEGSFKTINDSEFEIEKPYNDYMENREITPVQSNRFFGSTPENTPQNPVFTSLESVNNREETMNINNNFNTGAANDDFEIYDATPNNTNSNPFVDAGSFKTPEFSRPAPEFNKPQEIIKPEFNSQINPTAQMEINPNNRFFTPIAKDTSDYMTVETPNVNNTDIDPMDVLDKMDNNSNGNDDSVKDLKYAIDQTRNAIDSLGQDGFYIDVEEIDFPEVYQITMRIHKDN